MTQDEIIEMARQVGFKVSGELVLDDVGYVTIHHRLGDFAKLVAAKEREACAKKCEAVRETIWEYHEEHLKAAACNVCTHLAVAIRAKGQA
jgi:hypothetical protein